MIKSVLTAIETALKPNPNIRYVNEDWGQLDFYDQPPVLFPCVLLECEAVDFTSTGRRSQQAKGSVAVRVADVKMINQPNAKVLSSTTTEERFAFFDLLNEINKELHGLSGVDFTPLSRRSMNRARRDDGIREFVLVYDVAYVDNSAVGTTVAAPVPPVIRV